MKSKIESAATGATTEPILYFPEDNLRPVPNLVAGFQHVVAMFGATVLGPILMGFNPNTAILFSGIATVFFFLVVGGRIPSYLGSSFSFIAAVGLATGYSGSGPNPNLAVALTGIISAGVLYAIIGLVVIAVGHKWLDWLMPPVATGAIVAIIGLNLASVAVREVSGTPLDMAFGMATILAVIGCAVFFPKPWKLFPILIGGAIIYAAYWLLCNRLGQGPAINYDAFNDASLFGMPSFTLPVFSWRAIGLIAPVAFVLVAENLGHVRAIGAMTGRNLDPWLGRAFFADGLATIVSGSLGGTGVTTYAENIGVMSITKNFSSYTILIAAIFAICLGLSPKFGAAIATIPTPILGGLAFILFGLITANAGRIWQVGEVDFTQSKNLLVAGVAMVMGAGDLTWRFGSIAFGGIATATFSVLFIYRFISSSGGRVPPLMRGEP